MKKPGRTNPRDSIGSTPTVCRDETFIPARHPVDDILRQHQLGKYLILRRLGQGGMGVVYEAEDPSLGRRVAIKVLPKSSPTSDSTVRFFREARSAARLSHPNVVTIFEVNQQGDTPYIVMEMIEGQSADERIKRRGPFDWREATNIAIQACRGLSAAHAVGLIHRDVKPANLLCCSDGHVKLADFGLAKESASSATLTATGLVVGTPHYMSPEQCRSETVDARCDLYSLGATYYELLTGKPPFAGEGPIQIMFAHCQSPVPDPSMRCANIPAACGRIIERAMAKDADDRYASAREMLDDLERAQTATTREAPAQTERLEPIIDLEERENSKTLRMPSRRRAKKRRRGPVWVIALAVGAVILIALLPLLFVGKPDAIGNALLVTPPLTTNAEPKNKKILLVVPPRQYSMSDYRATREAFEKAKVRVVTASSVNPAESPAYQGRGSLPVDKLLKEVNAADYDGLVFIGAFGALAVAHDDEARALIRKTLAADKPVSALGMGSAVLAETGTLRGKKGTGFDNEYKNMSNLFRNNGATFVDEPVVVSDKIVTARDSSDAPQLVRKVIDSMSR